MISGLVSNRRELVIRIAFNDDSALIPFFFTIHRSNLGLSRVRIGIGKRTTRFEPRFYFHYQLNSIIQHPTLSLSLLSFLLPLLPSLYHCLIYPNVPRLIH